MNLHEIDDRTLKREFSTWHPKAQAKFWEMLRWLSAGSQNGVTGKMLSKARMEARSLDVDLLFDEVEAEICLTPPATKRFVEGQMGFALNKNPRAKFQPLSNP